jgi:hypothetical protein
MQFYINMICRGSLLTTSQGKSDSCAMTYSCRCSLASRTVLSWFATYPKGTAENRLKLLFWTGNNYES